MSVHHISSYQPVHFADNERMGPPRSIHQLQPTPSCSLVSHPFEDFDSIIGGASGRLPAFLPEQDVNSDEHCTNEAAEERGRSIRRCMASTDLKGVLNPLPPQSRISLSGMHEILETNGENQEKLSQQIPFHNQGHRPHQNVSRSGARKPTQIFASCSSTDDSNTSQLLSRGVDDLTTLAFCLKLPIRWPEFLLESECKICSKTFSTSWSLRGPEIAVQLPCCARLIGHKCIERLLRVYQGSTKICPWGCPLTGEDGSFIAVPSNTTETDGDTSQVWEIPDSIDYKELMSQMSPAQRKLYLSKRWRVANFITSAIRRKR